MSEPQPDAVQSTEWLARFILSSKWIRPGDNTVRPDAFIPRPVPNLDLSMYRHVGLSMAQQWNIGMAIAKDRGANLHGKADIRALEFLRHSLRIVPTPPRNHVNILGWPADKPAQKMLALELAAAAKFIRPPNLQQATGSES